MAASVLGKRARATESSKGKLPQRLHCHCLLLTCDIPGVPSLSSCRIKRRAILSPVNDENDDPSISQNEQNRIGCDGILQCDESEDHLSTPSKSRKFGVRSPGRPRAIAASPDQLHEYGNTSNQTSSMSRRHSARTLSLSLSFCRRPCKDMAASNSADSTTP